MQWRQQVTEEAPAPPPVRGLLLRDGVTFTVLLLVVILLYIVTSFLFHSFEERRQDFAAHYIQQGELALTQHRSEDAVSALRIADSFAPDDRRMSLLLAEALAQDNHTDEATNYFLNLRETQPGDGNINLQLARLARKKGDRAHAIDYYRSAVLGHWEQDAIAHRQQAELELVQYLIEINELASARAELLLAAANTRETEGTDLMFGDYLAAAKDPADAMTYYRKAIAANPHNAEAYEKIGRLLFASEDYAKAREMLELSIKNLRKSPQKASKTAVLSELSTQAEQLAKLAQDNAQPKGSPHPHASAEGVR